MSKAALARAGNIAELRELARRRLPSPLFDFLEGGAEDEGTLRRNTESFDRWDILPRFMTEDWSTAVEIARPKYTYEAWAGADWAGAGGASVFASDTGAAFVGVASFLA